MRYFALLLCFSVWPTFGALDFLEGTWQGVITQVNQPLSEGRAIWFEFRVDPSTGDFKGESRIEKPFTKYYAYKSIKGKVSSRTKLSFSDIFIGAQLNTGHGVWCLYEGDLTYNDSTGYLSGAWKSQDCRGKLGNITLYRSEYKMSHSDTMSLYHSWFNNLVNDLNRGWNAYYVREAEMRNFKFVPVYFDHDKDILKEEFKSYLSKMSDIVNSHSDLRIKIIGHTDSNGSDAYNVGLSERRADRVQAYLMGQGVPADKIVIEFRGEKDPATSNATSEGKRLNRRVDFEFI